MLAVRAWYARVDLPARVRRYEAPRNAGNRYLYERWGASGLLGRDRRGASVMYARWGLLDGAGIVRESDWEFFLDQARRRSVFAADHTHLCSLSARWMHYALAHLLAAGNDEANPLNKAA